MLRKLRKHLTDNADYVGGKFAEEARRIHFNEVEKRAIYGEATPQEAHALIEDGDRIPPAAAAARGPKLGIWRRMNRNGDALLARRRTAV